MSAQTTQTTLDGDEAPEDGSYLTGLGYAVWKAAELAPEDMSARDVATVALDAHETDEPVSVMWRRYQEGGR